MISKVRFSYHGDPLDSGRVITIARELDGNDVIFGFAVCKPTYWVADDPIKGETMFYLHKVEGDRFTKKRGRLLAEGRLAKKPWRVTRVFTDMGEGATELEHPMDAIRRFFEGGNVTVKNDKGEEAQCPDFILRTVAYTTWGGSKDIMNSDDIKEFVAGIKHLYKGTAEKDGGEVVPPELSKSTA